MIPKLLAQTTTSLNPLMYGKTNACQTQELAPKIVIAPQGEMTLNDGVWVETPGTGDKMAAWWHLRINDTKSNKWWPAQEFPRRSHNGRRHLRRYSSGCYDPIARLADMDINHVEASLCFPIIQGSAANYSLRQMILTWTTVRTGIQRLDDRRVVWLQ